MGTGKLKIENGELRIDMEYLVKAMSEEQLREFAQHIVFREVLTEGVIDMLAEGYLWEDCWWMGGDTFQDLREKLIHMMPDVAKEAIVELRNERESARNEAKQWRDVAWKLERMWNESKISDEHRSISYDYGRRWEKKDAAEYLRRMGLEIDGASAMTAEGRDE